ncbi:MAG TPA: ChbG/HpnK family deacetylase [Blastocatellia bacterium]|nr:ChbG/HpnK family deacetylase [Blastocatellia bacterium]
MKPAANQIKRLIVNADDFGLTAGVNRAIIEGHTRGAITSATLMANMPAFDAAVRLAREHPSLGVGLHINITQGRPVAEVSRVGSLVNDSGEFWGTSGAILKQMLTGKLKIEEVVVELRAQIEKALNAGLRLTHVDSHKHTHALPQICEAIISTIKEYGIDAVRAPRERWRFDRAAGSFEVIKQSAGAFGISQLCRVSDARLKKSNVKTPDFFFGVARTGFWTRSWLIDLIERLPAGVSELMCHPGYEDAELDGVKTRLRASRTNELRLLTDPDVVAKLKENGVKLINFSGLR